MRIMMIADSVLLDSLLRSLWCESYKDLGPPEQVLIYHHDTCYDSKLGDMDYFDLNVRAVARPGSWQAKHRIAHYGR